MIRILPGDCREVLATMPDASVHCCVTSPPYFGLRDYGTATWSGGDSECDHVRQSAKSRSGSGLVGATDTQGGAIAFGKYCGRCGATRADSQIGLEPTPAEFVAELVAVFREVRRVLRDDGTLWLNLGDSYAGSGRGGDSGASTMHSPQPDDSHTAREVSAAQRKNCPTVIGDRMGALKPKDLIGIPWRVAFALQADGWWLRQDIIWSKPNPMPESVTDRCTKSHEYLFMLSKSARYFYDQDAIKEPAVYFDASKPDESVYKDARSYEGKNTDKQRGHGKRHAGFNARWDARDQAAQSNAMRNKRSVWEVATKPYSEAHFATFPPALIEPCIKAGCPEGGVVLDPFGGAGTTGLVADRLQRDAILIELNPAYIAIAEDRIRGDAPLFADVK